jgi:hypothetical protein
MIPYCISEKKITIRQETIKREKMRKGIETLPTAI